MKVKMFRRNFSDWFEPNMNLTLERCYETFGLHCGATEQEIDHAFRRVTLHLEAMPLFSYRNSVTPISVKTKGRTNGFWR